MKPTKEQIEQIAFELFNSDYGLQMFKDDWEYRPQRFRDYYRNLAKVAIMEWEKTKEINKQTKEPQVKIPNEKDLEFLAYALPWRLHALLPSKHEDRDTLISEIIELWEKIRSDK